MTQRLNLGRMVWLALVLFLLAPGAPRLRAESSREKRMFEEAQMAFRDEFWQEAEAQFAEFARRYPDSEHYADAILYEAQARFQLHQYLGVIDLLSAQQTRAGNSADQFTYWTAEALFASTNYPAAADGFAHLARDYPASSRRLEAAVDQAESLSRLQDWTGAIAALRSPTNVFQQIASTQPTNELVARGLFLLAQAQTAQKDFSDAEETLQSLGRHKLAPALEWRRQYLLCGVQLAAGRSGDALQTSSNLTALAAVAKQPDLQAESVAFQAKILEDLGRLSDAADVYQANLEKPAPPDRQRQALLKILELNLRQNKTDVAAHQLEDFLARHPDEKTSDLALLTLAELRLKQYYQSLPIDFKSDNATPPGTNLLGQAITQAGNLVSTFPNSEYVGKAQLTLGWCYWAESKLPESWTAFNQAIEHLPVSEDQAVARFKLGDIEYQRMDYAGAISNYNAVISDYGSLPAVRNNLFERAWYQIVRAGLEETNLTVANDAMSRLLAAYPSGSLSEPGLLLLGEGLTRSGAPAQAREVLNQFINRFPNSSLRPEVELAIARTYEQEDNWTEAISQYETWTSRYTNDPALPRAEYCRAQANFEAGFETNAFAIFTNFVARFPDDDLAPRAQYWIADNFFRHDDFVNAEKNYQEVYENYKGVFQRLPSTELSYQARMMAGRTAVARQDYKEAMWYFTNNLTSDPLCPPDLKLQAQFAYGDAMIAYDDEKGASQTTETNSALSAYNEAIGVFAGIISAYPSNSVVPLAWGRIGNCYYQLATLNPNLYDSASNAYQMAIDSPLADVSTRSKAEVGLALTLNDLARLKPAPEQSKFLQLALHHYLNVVYGHGLHDGQQADPFWIGKAGLAAGQVAEQLGQWEQAIKLYQDLQEWLPPLQDTLDKKIAKARENIPSLKN